MEEAEQEIKLLLLSRQRGVPVVDCKPFKTMVELASVVKVTSLVLSGSITTGPLAVKVVPEAMVAPPLKVAKPEPAKVKVGSVLALPKVMFSAVLAVEIFK